MPRNYKKEYDSYHSKPEQKKKRAKRNAARKQAERTGKVKKGDGKDIDHKKPLRSGGSNSKKNLRVRSKSDNRADNGGKGGRPKKK
jgi:5-methylcytosine-specific restriction endonuclease McrA